MKKLRTPIILIAVLLIGINLSAQAQSNCKPTPAAPANDAKPVTEICTAGKTNLQNPDYSIQINGKENTVNITTDGTAMNTTETQTTLPTDKNSIEVSGEGNSVSINQETSGKVAVKQNGKNNRVSITQTPSIP